VYDAGQVAQSCLHQSLTTSTTDVIVESSSTRGRHLAVPAVTVDQSF
jgi:hypothetical protein